MKTPKLALGEFAYRFSLKSGSRWTVDAATALGRQLKLDGVPWGGLGSVGLETKEPVEVGLTVRGIRKATPNGHPASAFIVSGAAFTKEGKLVGWTTDFDESYPRECKLHFYNEKKNTYVVIADKARAAEIVKPAGAPAPKKKADTPTLRHKGDAIAVAFSSDGNFIASSGVDGFLRIWSAKDGAALHAVRLGTNLRPIAAAPSGDLLAGGATKITVISAATGAEVIQLKGHGSMTEVTALSFLGDSGKLVSTCQDLRLWDIKTGKLLDNWKPDDGDEIAAIAVSPKGDRIAVRTVGSLNLLDAKDLATLVQIKKPKEDSPGALAFAGSDLVADEGFKIVTYDAEKLTKKSQQKANSECLMAPDPSGRSVIALEHETLLRLPIDAAGKRQVLASKIEDGQDVAVSPDGKRIAVVAGPRVRIWDVATSQWIE